MLLWFRRRCRALFIKTWPTSVWIGQSLDCLTIDAPKSVIQWPTPIQVCGKQCPGLLLSKAIGVPEAYIKFSNFVQASFLSYNLDTSSQIVHGGKRVVSFPL